MRTEARKISYRVDEHLSLDEGGHKVNDIVEPNRSTLSVRFNQP